MGCMADTTSLRSVAAIAKSRKRTSGTIICQAALVSHVCQSYSLAHTLYRSTLKQIADIVVHPQRLQRLYFFKRGFSESSHILFFHLRRGCFYSASLPILNTENMPPFQIICSSLNASLKNFPVKNLNSPKVTPILLKAFSRSGTVLGHKTCGSLFLFMGKLRLREAKKLGRSHPASTH